MNWVILLLACMFEVGWTVGLKHAHGLCLWTVTIGCIIGSGIFFVMAMKRLPPSFAYICFVVIGMIGSYILDTVFFGKPMHAISIISIGIMLFCIIQLDRIK